MKHVLLPLLLALAGIAPGLAQAPPDTTAGRSTGPSAPPEYEAPITSFADSINRVFQYVDKTRVPSGILEEYGLQFMDHVPYTGTNGFTAANRMDINRWHALYGDLYGARINANAANLVPLATVNLRLNLYARDANVELPILHFDYHSIRTDALSGGRIRSVRNRLYDVAGQDPYQRNTAFAVAASNADLPSASTSFIFHSNQFWTNTGRVVNTIQADFADGNGFVNMTWNVARPVSYTTAGAKDVKVRVSYTDGSTWESHLLVVSPAPVPQSRYLGTPSIPAFTLTADKAYLGQVASATISVEYGGLRKPTPNAAVLDRPLIIVKGFDVSGILPSQGPNNGRSTYKNFVGIQINLTQGILLSDGADLDGYDLVYVDFDNGTDFIQRNAFLLERVLRWVNDHKQPLPGQTVKEPNVMLAMSMGGLVAQYALCDIEAGLRAGAGMVFPHEVRLLITHDSPHQGANIPLSMQMTIRHLAGTSIKIPFGETVKLIDRLPILGQARDALLSPAAQQMLRYQTTRGTVATGVFFAGPVIPAPASLYDTFQQEYQALLGPARVPVGTPNRPCRVVASSNGSECGRGQPFAPYAELVHFNYNDVYNVGFFSALLPVGTVGFAGWYAAGIGLVSAPVTLAATAVTALVALGFSGNYDITAEYRINALPDQQRQQIYSVFAQVNKRTRLFGLFRVQFTLIDFQGYSLPSQLPLDSGSGGIISLASYAQQLGTSSSSPSPVPTGAIKVSQFCFLPTYSALNIVPSGSAALRAQYSPGTSVGTPFANFRTAGRENEPHIEYTALNSNWMLQEMRGTNPQISCAAFCGLAPTISGPGTICRSGSTYTIAGLPAGTTVDWLLTTASGVSLLAATSPTFTTAFTSGIPSHSTLQATLNSDCGQFAISRSVDAGSALRVHSIYTAGCGLNAQADVIGATNVQWVVNGQLQTGLTVSDGDHEFFEYVNGRVSVAIRGTNDCTGAALASGAFLKIRPTTGPQCLERPGTSPAVVTIYPNPADEAIDVHVENADSTQAITVKMYDGQGQPRLEKTDPAGDDTVQLDTDALPDGIYYLEVVQDATVVDRQTLRIEQ